MTEVADAMISAVAAGEPVTVHVRGVTRQERSCMSWWLESSADRAAKGYEVPSHVAAAADRLAAAWDHFADVTGTLAERLYYRETA